MFTKIENRKIHYKKMGNGKPILFVHGWGGTLYSLHSLGCVAAKKTTSILLDLPGFGKSDNPPPHWGVEGYAEIIVKFINKLELQNTTYVGHSFGGELGIYIAAHYPKTISKLVLCNSSYKREKKVSKAAQLMKKLPEDKTHTFKYIKPHVKKLYYKLFHKDSDLMKHPHLESNFRKIITKDLTPETKKIKQDTLILWGEEDEITPVIWAYELKKNIPHAKLQVFPGVTHGLPLQHPDKVWAEIKPFINR